MSKIKKEKKELTPQQQKVRDILGWVVTGLCIAIIITCLIVSIITIGNSGSDKIVGIAGKSHMAVQTDSMEPTIMTGDLIIVDLLDEDERDDLQIGQVITYRRFYGYSGQDTVYIYVTHRISDIDVKDGKVIRYRVVGDNPELDVTEYVIVEDVIGKWGTPAERNADGTFNVTKDTKGGNMGQIGKLISTVRQDRTSYFLIVILPLIIIFLIYVFILVRSLVIAKIAKTKEEAMATTGVDGLSEEDKRRLAEEYLAQLARENAGADADTDSMDTTDATEDNPFEDENTDKGDVQA